MQVVIPLPTFFLVYPIVYGVKSKLLSVAYRASLSVGPVLLSLTPGLKLDVLVIWSGMVGYKLECFLEMGWLCYPEHLLLYLCAFLFIVSSPHHAPFTLLAS